MLIEVTFDIDANGIQHITAKALGTGKEQKITISADSGLSDAEVESMVNDAKSHAEEDKKAKEIIETKNKADSMVYHTEQQLKEHGDKLSDDVKQPVLSGIEKLKKDLEADNTDAMKTTMEELEQHLMKFGEEIYKQTQQEQGQPGAAGAAGAAPGADATDSANTNANDDNVVDAEVVEDDK
jgi:molecular chaperone DnaK